MAARGRAVQVDPMKPKMKPPGAKRLKLKCDILLSNIAFKFNLRRYSVAADLGHHVACFGLASSMYMVGRCRLTPG
jgi:hypothetical protein